MFQLIASYPKSGNTYVRIFLAHYLRGETDLNKTGFHIFASKANFPLYMVPKRSIRPFLELRICKTHETAYGFTGRFVDRAVYIVRNPLDVCLSFGRHMDQPLDKAIQSMGQPYKKLKGNPKIYPQHIGSWSTNVLSWLKQNRFPTLIIKYESLVRDPNEFLKILSFFGLPLREERFKAAVEFSKFSNLKAKEEQMLEQSIAVQSMETVPSDAIPEDASKKSLRPIAYKEARGSTGRFFNVGKYNQWQDKLSTDQITRILRDHGQVMQMLGYAKTISSET
jgi:hypothetical protein